METVSPKGWTTRPALDSLTALRFFAALCVVLYHRRIELSGAGTIVDRIVAHGFIGVPVFFVLSGFVLAYNYLGNDGRFRGSAGRFYVARLARIYPVYVLALLLFAPIALLSSNAIPAGQLASTVLSTVTLTQAWTELIYWNRPGWTLSVEAFFYLVFPLLAPPLCRLGRRRGHVVIAVLWLASMVPILLYGVVAPSDEIWLRVVKHNPLGRLPEFLIGVVLGRMFRDDATPARAGMWKNYVCASLVGIGLAMAVETPGSWALLWHNGFLAPLFGLLIYGLALRDRGPARVPSVLRRLGEASYAIYILQTPIHALCMGKLALVLTASISNRPAEVSSPWFVLAFIIVLGACALLSLRWCETPARAAIRRLAEGAGKPRVAPDADVSSSAAQSGAYA